MQNSYNSHFTLNPAKLGNVNSPIQILYCVNMSINTVIIYFINCHIYFNNCCGFLNHIRFPAHCIACWQYKMVSVRV